MHYTFLLAVCSGSQPTSPGQAKSTRLGNSHNVALHDVSWQAASRKPKLVQHDSDYIILDSNSASVNKAAEE
jgi:hypothetical protein